MSKFFREASSLGTFLQVFETMEGLYVLDNQSDYGVDSHGLFTVGCPIILTNFMNIVVMRMLLVSNASVSAIH